MSFKRRCITKDSVSNGGGAPLSLLIFLLLLVITMMTPKAAVAVCCDGFLSGFGKFCGYQMCKHCGQICKSLGGAHCCGRGACNMFCCNCDGGCTDDNCSPRNLLPTDHGIIGNYASASSTPWTKAAAFKFQSIDLNNDCFLDMDEARIFVRQGIKDESELSDYLNKSSLEHRFGDIDINKNGRIEPREMDPSLESFSCNYNFI